MTIETTYSQAREQLKTLMDRAVDDRFHLWWIL